jgi:phage gpG-like protein
VAIPRQSSDVYRKRTRSAGSGRRTDLAIQVDGLREFRRALKSVSPEAEKEVRDTLRTFGNRALAKAKRNSPVSPKTKMVKGQPVAPGSLRDSIKVSVTQREAALYSNSPYARAHEWGAGGRGNSQMRPKGVPIKIPRSQMLGNAVYFYRNTLGYELANLVDKSAEKYGIETGPTVRQSRYGGGRIISATR